VSFPNYPEILKIFYRYSFPDQLGANASSLAQALIYKANDLYFPPSFKMSNTELSHLSGVLINNIGRTRQKVLDICEFDGVPMFTYVENGKRLAGKYTINYFILSTRLQVDISVLSDSRQKEGVFDNDPNSTLPSSTKQRSPDTQNLATKQSELENGEAVVVDNLQDSGKKPVDAYRVTAKVKSVSEGKIRIPDEDELGRVSDTTLQIWKDSEDDRAVPATGVNVTPHPKTERPAEPLSNMQPGHIEVSIELRTKLAEAISGVWKLKGRPTDNSIRKALDEFRGDSRPLFHACEQMKTKESLPDIKAPAPALKYILKVAKGNSGAVSYPQYRELSTDPKIDELEKYLKRCVEFRRLYVDVYPCLVELARLLKQPIDKVYAEREFLPAGELGKFEEASKYDEEDKTLESEETANIKGKGATS